MDKPLGYYCLSNDNPLIRDISITWGDYLQNLSKDDAYWLMGRIGNMLWDRYAQNAPSEEAEEVIDRLRQLSEAEQIRLIQAISNK